jgi:hypothetical protein
MTDHPIAKAAITLIDSIYDEVHGSQLRVQVSNLRAMIVDLNEIIGNLNQIAIDAFEAEAADCGHCGSHDHSSHDHQEKD